MAINLPGFRPVQNRSQAGRIATTGDQVPQQTSIIPGVAGVSVGGLVAGLGVAAFGVGLFSVGYHRGGNKGQAEPDSTGETGAQSIIGAALGLSGIALMAIPAAAAIRIGGGLAFLAGAYLLGEGLGRRGERGGESPPPESGKETCIAANRRRHHEGVSKGRRKRFRCDGSRRGSPQRNSIRS